MIAGFFMNGSSNQELKGFRSVILPLRKMIMEKRLNYLLPLLFAVFLAIGMVLGTKFNPKAGGKTSHSSIQQKFDQVLGYIEHAYVDTPDQEYLVETAIQNMLEELDPYSSYISAKDLSHATEQLEGNFEGIGVEFNILKDTVTVLHVLAGGPSERLGLLPGDKFVLVDGEKIAGIGIKNTDVVRKLKGPKGTKVNVAIKRRSAPELLEFEIERDEIKIASVVANFMANPTTGYIKVTRFASNTANDFELAIKALKEKGARNMVIDLRGNPGGYLGAATRMVGEFLEKGEMITYTEGRERPRDEHKSSGNGQFQEGNLCVLIDEGSASASEIFSGAIQDLDRGLIIGTRSHGKGLVQEPIELKDGSQLRLTVARYYTPSGRCIQRPYDFSLDITKEDTVRTHDFATKSGRKVSDGGGIAPDIEVLPDTSFASDYYLKLARKGLVYEVAANYADNNRTKLKEKYSNFDAYLEGFEPGQSMLDSLIRRGERVGVAYDEEGLKKARSFIELQCKALIARHNWGDQGYYEVMAESDAVLKKALSVIENDQFAVYGIN